MTAIDHDLVTRTAINVSLIDLVTSNQINGGNKALSLRHKEILFSLSDFATLHFDESEARQARFLYLDVSSKSVSFYGRCDANHPSFCHLKSICCVYSGFSDPCGLGLDCQPPRLVHLQDLPQQRHLVTKPTFR